MRAHHDLGDDPFQGEQDLVKGSHATFSRLVASRREAWRHGDAFWTSLGRSGIRLLGRSTDVRRIQGVPMPRASLAVRGRLDPLSTGYTSAFAGRRAEY